MEEDMRFIKKLLCVLLVAALLLATPGAVLALEGEDIPEEDRSKTISPPARM